MKNNPVGWFEIYVDDMKRATKFYESVFQTELKELPAGPEIQMMAFPMEMNAPGAAGSLCKMPGLKAGGNNVIIYFMSDDCSVEEKRVADAGGKVFKPKMSIGEHGFITLAIDTEGNMFGVHSRK